MNVDNRIILSIIIPVYKVEQYLNKCIDSCYNPLASNDRFEVIAVNDGSPDRCGLILAEYEHKHDNFHVISQENQGLSAARNAGLQLAHGRYVWFVDSDDWLEPNAVSRVIDILRNDDIDILQIRYRNVYENDSLITTPAISKWEGTISGTEYMQLKYLPTPVQFNIYRRDLLIDNNLRFAEGILHEDIEFKPRVLHFCKRCKCLNTVLYNYLQRNSGSITSSYKPRNGMDLITVMSNLADFCKSNVTDHKELEFFYRRISISMNLFIRIYKRQTNEDQRRLKENIIPHTDLFDMMVNSNKLIYRLEGIIFKLWPSKALKILSAM